MSRTSNSDQVGKAEGPHPTQVSQTTAHPGGVRLQSLDRCEFSRKHGRPPPGQGDRSSKSQRLPLPGQATALRTQAGGVGSACSQAFDAASCCTVFEIRGSWAAQSVETEVVFCDLVGWIYRRSGSLVAARRSRQGFFISSEFERSRSHGGKHLSTESRKVLLVAQLKLRLGRMRLNHER